jgi:flagellar basal body-associated protein FliL
VEGEMTSRNWLVVLLFVTLVVGLGLFFWFGSSADASGGCGGG